MIDNTNLGTPDFAPGLPLYPDLEQLCRVSAAALAGTSPAVYPAFVDQFNPPLGFRDREACYVVEPNRIVLGPGHYDCRLIGSFPTAGHALFGVIAQLPLYATTCCVAGSFGSSSSSSASATNAISFVNLGTYSGNPSGVNVFTTVLSSKTVPAGTRLVVQTGVVATGGAAANIASVTFAGTTLNTDVSSVVEISGAFHFRTRTYALIAGAAMTGDLVVETSNPLGAILLLVSAEYESGLPINVLDGTANNAGLASTPDTGTATTTDSTNEICQAAFLLLAGVAGTWGGGFTSGGQDVSGTLTATTFVLTEGYKILTDFGTVDATMSGITTAWAGVLSTYG